MLKLKDEVKMMFSGYGLKFEQEAQVSNTPFDEALDVLHIDALPKSFSYNETIFTDLHELVLDGKANEKQQAQYTFLNENFSMDPTEYRFGDLNPRNNEDEKFDPLDKFYVRFGQEKTQDYHDGFDGVGMTHTHENIKFWLSVVQDKEWTPKDERLGIKQSIVTENLKFSLIKTSGSGEVWIPNEIASEDRWMLDAVDQELATWDMHVEKVKRF